MSHKMEFLHLREQAIALRRAGKSRREIKDLLAITSNRALNEAVKGEPPQPWTWRPNAKDPLRDQARELRQQGLNYNQIAGELGVSKSSVSLWVRDIPRPPGLSYEECRKRAAEGVRRYWATERPIREAQRESVRLAAAAEVGELSQREIIIAGAIAYWCEGAKTKPYRRKDDRVSFINSDPALIKFFLHFLATAGIAREQLIFRIYVHESADTVSAQRFWLDVTQARPGQFRSPTLKRHNPATVRKNVGDGYHGCLRIDVRQSVGLYQKIEGWAAAMAATDGADRTQPGPEPTICSRARIRTSVKDTKNPGPAT
jgi:predicted transcriptional regulator